MRGKNGSESRADDTHSYVVFEFDSSRRVKVDLFQSLPDNIVGLSLTLLGGLDSCGFVNVAFVVDIEPSECVG